MNDPTQRAPLRRRGAKGSTNSRAGSEQHTQLSLDESGPDVGGRLAVEGMTRAKHGEDVRIVAAAETEVRRLAAMNVEFTPDDVLPDLVSRRAIGSVFSKLRREGVIVCVGATTSTREARHGALTRVWRGADGGDV